MNRSKSDGLWQGKKLREPPQIAIGRRGPKMTEEAEGAAAVRWDF